MNSPLHNEQDRNAEVMEAEKSLRMIASLPSPIGIEDRVKARLRTAPAKAGMIGWPAANRANWTQAWYMRAAAAAAIVFVVAGGGWGVHARFRSAPEPAAEAVPQRIGGSGGFSSSGAMRTLKTVDAPKVVVPLKQQTTGAENGAMKKRAHGGGAANKGKVNPSAAPAVR